MLQCDFFKGLNDKQREAVTWNNGPLLVVAGAGSGKTRTLAYRVAYLIRQGVAPDRILLLTFTRRAAQEMISRASSVLGEKTAHLISGVWGGTFHATANRLLRIYGKSLNLAPEFTIMDQSDAEDMLQVIRHKCIDKNEKKRFPRKSTLLAIYSRRINSGEDITAIIEKWYPWCEYWIDHCKGIFKEYIHAKQIRNVLDYDDLLLYWKYLVTESNAADTINARFDHILVDEYQDTNQLQAEILLAMRKVKTNITVVGDDAQSIYSFRAATVRNMLDFPQLFPHTHTVVLEHNYRSSDAILTTTNTVIVQAKKRFSKTLFSTRGGCARPQLVTCSDEGNEASIIADTVLRHREEGIDLHKQAVLFRAGSHSAALEIELMKREIPYRKWGGLKFLEAAHIKDFISFIRIIENPRDEISWYRILQLFKGIGPVISAKIYEHLSATKFDITTLGEAAVGQQIRKHLQHLADILGCILKQKADLCVELDVIRKLYMPLLEEKYDNSKPRSNDIDHIIGLASSYRSRRRFLSEMTLDPPSSTSDFAGVSFKEEDYLILSTIHSAKGCEWDVVYLIHAADGCLPSDMSTDDDDTLEEELRLAYVAMTRAKNKLYVTWPLRFYSRPQGFSDMHVFSQRSRFFSDAVVATMEEVHATGACVTDIIQEYEYPIDISDKLRGMWE